MITNRIFPFGMILCFGLFAGCTQKLPDGFPKLYPTTLTVTQEGTPLAEASVILYSADDPSFRWVVTGVTDSKGNAPLGTFATTQIRKNGAPAGKFKVTVTKTKSDEVPVLSPVAEQDEIDAWRAQMRQLKPQNHKFVEQQYSDINATPLEVVIEKKTNAVSVDAGKKIELSEPMLY